MRIDQPTQQPIQFRMKWSSHTHKTIDGYISKMDEIILDNGKILRINTESKNGVKETKLQYLIDKTGKWIKSKLRYFSDNKTTKVLTSERNFAKNI